ncbi:uncharacterized protein A1O9_03373 [Exophiala aquamarina CBS 119918]|uniref:Aldehyde dehydrogenase domain-containing protein n=1 Tax=Exophiala aquamarina CBS 119918 TaxID=1182545 RepID=A0A072PR71_9EURO|nr:uncharacterized protein A1O9_03373 [Exophiala aquamarina CBS 119918]KEF61803.1 hypothetical protein A1O9_03373 [Exophiala aquamarina CBS 119918]
MSTMKSPAPNPFPRISIADIEGTARSLRHRQLQFHRLQPIIVKNKALLIRALEDDYGYSPGEALFEYSLSLSEVRFHYESIDFEKEVAATKTIENGNERLNRYAGVGIVYIVPRGGLYSVLSPLCAAMAAGNCVIVELLQTTNRTSSALRDSLQEALSGDTFAISKERPAPSFLRQCAVVLQANEILSTQSKGSSDLLWSKKLIASPSSAKNVAFVDRTADLRLAARTLVVAKFGFGNTSAYAPDVIFVHEAVAKAFSTHTVEIVSRSYGGLNTGAAKQKLLTSEKGLGGSKQLDGHKVLLSGKRGAIVELPEK